MPEFAAHPFADRTHAQLAAELLDATRELARCYEELALLYRFSARMAINQPPDDCVGQVCHDLRVTLNLQWVAVLFDSGNAPARLAGTFHLEGDPGIAQHHAAALLSTLAEQLHPGTQGALLPPDELAAAVQEAQLPIQTPDRPLLFVPIQHDGHAIGTFLAARHPDQRAPSAADLKLCASLVNGLAIFLRNTRLYDESREMFFGSLHALVAAIDAKDAYTHGHSKRVALLSRMLAQAAGLDEDFQQRAYLAGLVHDVGKIGVHEAVLSKPGLLSDDEYDEIKQHPRLGARILRDVRQMAPLIPGVLYHHERWDGRGYPEGLAGDQTPLLARVIGLADAFDAMSSDRTYRSHMPPTRIREEIAVNSAVQFDPRLVDAFLQMDTQPHRRMLQQQINAPGRSHLKRSA